MGENNVKHILLIATGGTVASRDIGRGLAPALTGDELLEFLPELSELCRVHVENPFSIDSTDMNTAMRTKIAHMIWENAHSYDGFVIAHGTDTLSHTAALLYHMLQNFNRPVILTGAMKPVGVAGSDAERNLLDSFRVACSGYVGVSAVVGGRIIRGDHVVKVDSFKPDAFRSVNAPQIGYIDDNGRVIMQIVPKLGGKAEFNDVVPVNYMLLKIIPEMDASILEFLFKYDKIIIEGYGAGGVPQRLEKVIQRLIQAGSKVYLTTQCLEGGADMKTYEVGRRAQAMGAVCLSRRTIEDAIAAILCGEI